MKNIFDVVLLNALPASGKSELRKFMNSIPKEKMEHDFHIGNNIQLDDFPYVFAMRKIDNILLQMSKERIYYSSDDLPAKDGRIWGVLSILLSEDYHDVLNNNKVYPESAAKLLFHRFDKACIKVGLSPFISLLESSAQEELALALEPLAQKMLKEKQDEFSDDLSDKTIIIEFARGGHDGASFPLRGTEGYQYAYRMLDEDLLQKAVILYVWVDPAEARKKNRARYNPNDPGSSIHHMTAEEVMLKDYGCDDIVYLKGISKKENTITISTQGKEITIPVGIYDNRNDYTTQFRNDPSTWDEKAVQKTYEDLMVETSKMWIAYQNK